MTQPDAPTRYVTDEFLILGPIPGGGTVRQPSLTQCDRCGGRSYTDVPIHAGQSTRRQCATGHCRRTWGFPVWYGVKEQ